MNMKRLIESMDRIEECGMGEGPMGMPPAAPMDRGNPVSMNVSLNASGKEHVEDLINMMKNAGMSDAKEITPMDMPALPMRMDMERLRDIVDEPKKELPAPEGIEEEGPCEECGMDPCECDHAEEGYDNEPDEQYGSIDDIIDTGDDLHKAKKAYPKVQDGDNAMALEQEILKALKADYATRK